MLAAPWPYRDGALDNGVALHHARRGRQSSATQLREIAADQAVSKPSAVADPGKLVVAASAPRTRRYLIFGPDLHRRACDWLGLADIIGTLRCEAPIPGHCGGRFSLPC